MNIKGFAIANVANVNYPGIYNCTYHSMPGCTHAVLLKQTDQSNTPNPSGNERGPLYPLCFCSLDFGTKIPSMNASRLRCTMTTNPQDLPDGTFSLFPQCPMLRSFGGRCAIVAMRCRFACTDVPTWCKWETYFGWLEGSRLVGLRGDLESAERRGG
ncbi:uncharacterized protein BCR38DRAFT_140629 [Pseudomassariella vexata]|uniref:Uncharacterized protein n=1 Tax=Pseudomassariella vexata TaxID=1141098 RepID=A0A1Y2EC86_9PEZI|nr:uncharacterized protein BCR38DRAFT_140629 [Pseudomassariella vexata]ORY68876.1 hypothetical protein BCR38DRAFT_140629 [Pseudomassariella vexata]